MGAKGGEVRRGGERREEVSYLNVTRRPRKREEIEEGEVREKVWGGRM